MSDLPEPLVPPEVDLRDFPAMMLDVVRLRDSELATHPDGELFRANVLAWCVAWHQSPSASLPDDDATLARLLGYGRDLRTWKKIRAAGGLRGWVKCSDGRLYHPVVAEKAVDAWKSKLQQRCRTECARIKKHNQRHGTSLSVPDFDEWLSLGCPSGQILHVPTKPPDCPQGQTTNVSGENHSKGSEGKGSEQGKPSTDSTLGSSAEPQKPPASPSAARGTRLPKDFKLPKAWGDWALDERKDWTPEHVRQVGEKFKDHWIAQPGQKGVKTDWLATWRNWVRSESIARSIGNGQDRSAVIAAFTGPSGGTGPGAIDGEARRVGTG